MKNYYILGTIIGFILLFFCLLVFLFFYFEKLKFNKVVKNFKKTNKYKINNDIKIWIKYISKKIKIKIFQNIWFWDEKNQKNFVVDSIIVSEKWLIVVSIMSYKNCDVQGDYKNFNWEKIIENKSYPILNPIFQNDLRIKKILQIIGEKIPTISLIVTSNKIKNINIENSPNYAVIIKKANLFETLDDINNQLESFSKNKNFKNIINKIKVNSSKRNTNLKKNMKIIKKYYA